MTDPRCPVHPQVRLQWVATAAAPGCQECSSARVRKAFALLAEAEANEATGS